MKKLITILLGVVTLLCFSCDNNDGNIDEKNENPVYDNTVYNWQFENWLVSDPPPGFTITDSNAMDVVKETINVNSGNSSTKISWDLASPMSLYSEYISTATSSTEYSFHVWMYDYDTAGRTTLGILFLDSAEQTLLEDRAISHTTDADYWKEYVYKSTSPAGTSYVKPFITMDTDSDWEGSSELYVDDWAVSKQVSFDAADGQLDPEAILITGDSTGVVTLYAAVNNSGILYVSVDRADAGVNYDYFVYVWIGSLGSGTVDTPWSKSGTVAGPTTRLIALAQEESNSFCQWLEWNGADWDGGFGSCNSGGMEPRLEGTVDLVSLLSLANYEDIPSIINISFVAYGTNDGDNLIPATQVPGSLNGDGNIDSNEVKMVHRSRILAGCIAP